MTLCLRTDDLPDDALVLVHLGAGAADTVLKAALLHYGAYRHLTPTGRGCFAISMFAADHGFSVDAIVSMTQRRQYGTTTAGQVRRLCTLWPTSDLDPELAGPVRALQSVHYDAILPEPVDHRLDHLDPSDDEDLGARCKSHLAPHVDRFLALFDRPRRQYDGTGGAHA